MNVDSPTPSSRVGGRLTVVISHSRRYQNTIELYSALSRPVDVPTTIVPGPSWYPLIGVEIPGLPISGRSDIWARGIVFTYASRNGSIRCSVIDGLREHTSDKWKKWMLVLSQPRQPEVDLIGVSPETDRRHLV